MDTKGALNERQAPTITELLEWVSAGFPDCKELSLHADMNAQTFELTVSGAHSSNPASTAIPKIGEYWPDQGGYNAGLMRNDNGDDYFLIVSPKICEFTDCFGEAGKEIKTDWLDGYANTQLLLKSGNYPAAKKCAEIIHEGHSDFYLWSRREARMACANVPELFDKQPWYLTSTQYSADNAYVQGFESGRQDYYHKPTSFGSGQSADYLFVH